MKATEDAMMREVCRPLEDTRLLPPVNLPTPATEFIQNHIDPSYAPAFHSATGIIFDPSHPLPGVYSAHEGSTIITDLVTEAQSLSKKDVASCYNEADIQRELFTKAMEEFEASLPKKYRTGLRIGGKHSWEEVMKEAEIAEATYAERVDKKKFTGKIRSCLRSFQKHAGILEAWIGLIPSDVPFSSVLCAGLKLILKVRFSRPQSEVLEIVT